MSEWLQPGFLLGELCKVGVWLKSFGSEVSLSSASDNGLSLSQMLGKNYVFLSLEPLRKLEFVCFEKFPEVFWRHNCLPMLEWT